MKITHEQFQERVNLSLSEKEHATELSIVSWYEHWKGKVYVSFSGGKDSTVLLHQVRRVYPDVPAVFVDTGLEYPEIRNFVKTVDNVVWLKPKMTFKSVIEKYGFPVVSKRQSRFINDIQNASEKNKATVNLRLTGYNRNNEFLPSMKLSKKWISLARSNINVSDKCCDELKKKPFYRYQKETGRFPITGTMAVESRMRLKTYLAQGCNTFTAASKNSIISIPLSFWVEQDIWDYIKKYKLSYSCIYNMGEKRTGCMFCMFGVHLEKGENRFQRMKKTHPKQYKYCIEKLGCGKVLDFIGVDYR